MKNVFQHLRMQIFRGLLAIIPILLCAVSIQLLYVVIDKRIIGFLSQFFEVRRIPGMGILLVLVSLYLVGLIASNIIGHRFLKLVEMITEKIPFVKTVYGIGKQIAQGLSMADEKKQAFQRTVLVRIKDSGIWVPAFVTNSTKDQKTGEELLVVLIPTAPTPASGFVCVVKASETLDPGWTVEECLKAVVSVGIIIPHKEAIYLEGQKNISNP